MVRLHDAQRDRVFGDKNEDQTTDTKCREQDLICGQMHNYCVAFGASELQWAVGMHRQHRAANAQTNVFSRPWDVLQQGVCGYGTLLQAPSTSCRLNLPLCGPEAASSHSAF